MENLKFEMQKAIEAGDIPALKRLIDQSDREEWRGHRQPEENLVYLKATLLVIDHGGVIACGRH